MNADFLTEVLTPSPILHWLLIALPATLALAGLMGALQREPGNRRLAAWATVLVVWLFVPLQFDDPVLAQLSQAASMLAWLGLLGHWAKHVWFNRPTPVWAHGLVITHVVAILIAGLVALFRAALAA
ncbi:hypothetical protein Q9295_16995 [Xinfangfangia sp. CPCC 101601]|uniref:Uncharacterized protein n=1 Tax=Pseudogemmobacter lacusdianii TaxID=3069608 RepID=A0ABU0W230_9RHOB|nr:hypothetical protein [Xinfangfangia sp. CPCC 101601]MDQ2068071.1 hypothetical protein [Xinfangfangia sp. CPCC 101601]